MLYSIISTPETGGLVCQFQHLTVYLYFFCSFADTNIDYETVILQINQYANLKFTVFLMITIENYHFCKEGPKNTVGFGDSTIKNLIYIIFVI